MKKQKLIVGEQPANSKTLGQEFNAENDTIPALAVDLTQYAHYLEGMDLREEERLAFLQSLYKVACEFVLFGFGIHPIQRKRASCGENAEDAGNQELASGQIIEENYSQMVGFPAEPRQEGN